MAAPKESKTNTSEVGGRLLHLLPKSIVLGRGGLAIHHRKYSVSP